MLLKNHEAFERNEFHFQATYTMEWTTTLDYLPDLQALPMANAWLKTRFMDFDGWQDPVWGLLRFKIQLCELLDWPLVDQLVTKLLPICWLNLAKLAFGEKQYFFFSPSQFCLSFLTEEVLVSCRSLLQWSSGLSLTCFCPLEDLEEGRKTSTLKQLVTKLAPNRCRSGLALPPPMIP